MRLEFARSNTKVTKPKWPQGFPLAPGAPTGFPFIPAAGNPAGLSPVGQQTAFPGVIQPNYLPHLAGCTFSGISVQEYFVLLKLLYRHTGLIHALTSSIHSPQDISAALVDPATMALITAQDPTQWAANPHFGYDSSGLFASIGAAPAALLQASNFRVS